MTTKSRGESSGAGSELHAAERLEAAHDLLRDQLDAVADANTPTAMAGVLFALHEMLREHFALEEQFDGFYDQLQARLPSMSHDLDALRNEHGVILDECDSLCQRVKDRMKARPADGQVDDETKRGVTDLLDRLRRHEHQESVLIGDAYYTDEGGRG